MVRRHIRQSERHIREQHARIARLKEIGSATGLAEELLAEMLTILGKHQLHLDRLLG